MGELTDEEISVLHEILWDEVDRYLHEPSRGDDGLIVDALYGKVHDEAKKRRLWWAR